MSAAFTPKLGRNFFVAEGAAAALTGLWIIVAVSINLATLIVEDPKAVGTPRLRRWRYRLAYWCWPPCFGAARLSPVWVLGLKVASHDVWCMAVGQ